MEDCVRKGLGIFNIFSKSWFNDLLIFSSCAVRSIGVSNFNSKQLQRILDICEIKPVTNQVCESIIFITS